MKKDFKFFFALWTAKLTEKVLVISGHNATQLPGKIAIKLCPDFLGKIGRPKKVACVTGTNGKTTICNLTVGALKASGYSLTCNSYGSNIAAGIASALISSNTIFGKAKHDLAVLEVDERSSLLIYPYLKPDYVLCSCLFRDSIKRNANTDFISYIITKALPEDTTLILNGDDIICSGIGSSKNKHIYFGVSSHYGPSQTKQDISDSIYCPECGAPLQHGYLRYNHIGRMFCNHCGFKSPTCDYVVTDVDTQKGTITLEHGEKSNTFKMVSDNIVNIYNMAASIALLDNLGLEADKIADYFENAKIVSSRYDTDKCGDVTITMQLAKGQNSVACSRAIDYVCSTVKGKKDVIVMVDDKHDNTNNSENICWIYDVDYAPFADESVSRVIFAGPRCRDHVVRALLSGVKRENIFTTEDIFQSVSLIEKSGVDYCILYDLYLYDEAVKLKQMLKDELGKGEE